MLSAQWRGTLLKQVYKAILGTVTVVVLAVFAVVLWGLHAHYSAEQEEHLRTALQLAASGVEAQGRGYLNGLAPSDCRLTWVAADGAVLFDTETPAGQLPNHGEREEIHEAFLIGEGRSARYSETMLTRTINLATKINSAGHGAPTVLRISAEQVTPLALVLRMGGTLLLMLALAAGLAVLMARRMAGDLVAPLNTLNLDEPLKNDVYDELSPLLHRIHRQQRHLERQYRQLRAQTEEFVLVSQGMQEGLVLLDDRAVVLSMNPAARRLFGATDDPKGRAFYTIDRAPELTAAIAEAQASGHAQLRLPRRGREYQFDLSRIDSDDKARGLVMLAFDVTEQAALEQQRREFTGNVSHELKTPLQSIMGSAELLANDLVAPEDAPRFVQHIRAESARLMALIDDILRLSQLDEQSPQVAEQQFAAVSLYEVAAEAVRSLAGKAAARGVTVTLAGDERATVNGERALLLEMTVNLVDNAIKYNVEGGRVSVEVGAPDEASRFLAVADTGIGIPAEYQSKVFERFFRVDKSHSKTSGGTGLGLSIVKHAAALHHATVALASELGKGTTVTVRFAS